MRILRFLVLATTLSLVACSGSSKDSSAKQDSFQLLTEGHHTVGQDEFSAQIAAYVVSSKPFYLLDVRTPEELAETGKIKGALNMDFRSGEFAGSIGDLDKSLPTLVYCRSGGRSGEASMIMEKLGFDLVINLDGGMNAWLEAGNEVEPVETPKETPES